MLSSKYKNRHRDNCEPQIIWPSNVDRDLEVLRASSKPTPLHTVECVQRPSTVQPKPNLLCPILSASSSSALVYYTLLASLSLTLSSVSYQTRVYLALQIYPFHDSFDWGVALAPQQAHHAALRPRLVSSEERTRKIFDICG